MFFFLISGSVKKWRLLSSFNNITERSFISYKNVVSYIVLLLSEWLDEIGMILL